MSGLIRSGRKIRHESYTLVLTPAPIPPFSWGHYIILSEEDFRNYPDEILTHEKVPMNYLEKMKALFDANSIKCVITKASGYDDNGNALPTPPPPPPAPDVYVTFNYKDGKKDGGMLVYERYLKTGKEIDKRFDEIYTDDISIVTIKTYKWSKEGVLEGVEKILKDKIKYDVEYKVVKE